MSWVKKKITGTGAYMLVSTITALENNRALTFTPSVWHKIAMNKRNLIRVIDAISVKRDNYAKQLKINPKTADIDAMRKNNSPYIKYTDKLGAAEYEVMFYEIDSAEMDVSIEASGAPGMPGTQNLTELLEYICVPIEESESIDIEAQVPDPDAEAEQVEEQEVDANSTNGA